MKSRGDFVKRVSIDQFSGKLAQLTEDIHIHQHCLP